MNINFHLLWLNTKVVTVSMDGKRVFVFIRDQSYFPKWLFCFKYPSPIEWEFQLHFYKILDAVLVFDLRHFNRDVEHLSIGYIPLYLMTWDVEYISNCIFANKMMRWHFYLMIWEIEYISMFLFVNKMMRWLVLKSLRIFWKVFS